MDGFSQDLDFVKNLKIHVYTCGVHGRVQMILALQLKHQYKYHLHLSRHWFEDLFRNPEVNSQISTFHMKYYSDQSGGLS